jgi:hypothetical protein
MYITTDFCRDELREYGKEIGDEGGQVASSVQLARGCKEAGQVVLLQPFHSLSPVLT